MSKIVTNQFAEDLGYTFGGSIRDLVRFTAREAARISKAKLPLFDFLNPGEGYIYPDTSSIFTVAHITDLHIKNKNRF